MITILKILIAGMVAIPIVIWLMWLFVKAVARAELRRRARLGVDISNSITSTHESH